jgi:hypothetical protein
LGAILFLFFKYKTMNKQINTTLAITVIVLIAGISGMLIYSNGRARQQPENNNTPTASLKNNIQQQIDNNNYKKYSNAERGISFVYPKWWGDVYIPDNFSDGNTKNDDNITFLKTTSLSVGLSSEQNSLPTYTDCPNGKEDLTRFFGRGTSYDDLIFCKKTESNGQLIIQSFLGSQGSLDKSDSYGVSVETIIYSPDKSKTAIVRVDRPEILNCRSCGISYKEFVKNEKDRIKNSDACVQGEATLDKSNKDMFEIKSPCQLSDDETRELFELNNFIQTIRIKN